MTFDIEYDWAAHDARIREHYDHARRKHPCFCDHKAPLTFSKEQIFKTLSYYRGHLGQQTKTNNVRWDTVLMCELWEIMDAISDNDDAHAVEECYDAISVLLRVVDVLEGRQELGKPETKGGTK